MFWFCCEREVDSSFVCLLKRKEQKAKAKKAKHPPTQKKNLRDDDEQARR
jgi:hypothetical protein